MQFLDVSAYGSHTNTEIRVNILSYAVEFADELTSRFVEPAFHLTLTQNFSDLKKRCQNFSINDLNTVIVIEVNNDNLIDVSELISGLKNNFITKNLITIFLVKDANSSSIANKALQLGVSDCYQMPVDFNDIIERIKFLAFYKVLRSQVAQLSEVPQQEYKIPLGKRILDVALAGSSLIVLSPFFLVVAALIKLDSKGPVFYTSKRVGTGYKIFDFYKFRSMRVGADAEVSALAEKNQYGKSAFFKVQNDPRITRLGNFIRSSSIDELPQLLNVIKGDMSLVGNRPLPLYEAEQLTTNEWSMRFLGPAGLTGLWQISKRGKKEMSEMERKELDNYYSKNYSLWLDFKIILKTLPALLQKEKV